MNSPVEFLDDLGLRFEVEWLVFRALEPLEAL
jgi:hypothetical protein